MMYFVAVLFLVASAAALPQAPEQEQQQPPQEEDLITAAAAPAPAAVLPAGVVECKPDGDLFVPDPFQCDKYYECTDAGPVEHLCPDGLVFDDEHRGRRGVLERCDYPFNIDCGVRDRLQPPTGRTVECPRANGIFAHEDPSVCNKFYLCVGGDHQTYTCDRDLHFNEYTGVCEWINVAGRTGCRPQIQSLADGFTCPLNDTVEHNGVAIIHPLYAHPEDCQKYYICLNGHEPRASGCPSPTVFNDVSMKCDDPANVPGCENWFGTEDEEKAQPPAGSSGNNKVTPGAKNRRRR